MAIGGPSVSGPASAIGPMSGPAPAQNLGSACLHLYAREADDEEVRPIGGRGREDRLEGMSDFMSLRAL